MNKSVRGILQCVLLMPTALARGYIPEKTGQPLTGIQVPGPAKTNKQKSKGIFMISNDAQFILHHDWGSFINYVFTRREFMKFQAYLISLVM